MNQSLTKQQIEHLKALGVSVVYLFGSSAEGMAHPLSDVDVGVVFKITSALEGNTNGLYNQLYDLFTDVFPDRAVDIVFLQNAGLEVCLDAATHGVSLYTATPDARYDFEERVILLYADFKPHLDQFNKAVLDRISD
jgi:predicted nucleotidyltransferase